MARNDWLRQEMETWARDGLISAEQAEALRLRYPLAASRPWGLILFGAAGAIILGLGIILLFAYNWAAIPKLAKLALIFGAMLAAHIGGGWLYLRSERWRGVGEALTVLGTMCFGSSIWLVAQVYHIDEHYPNGFLWWGIGATLLAWAMPSIAQAIVAVIVLAIWGMAEAGGFHTPILWAPWLIALILGGLAWKERSRVLLVTVLPVMLLTFVVELMNRDSHCAVPAMLQVGALLVAAGVLAHGNHHFPKAAVHLRAWGYGLYLGFLFVFSFHDFCRLALRDMLPVTKLSELWCYVYGLPIVAIGLWGWLLWRAWRSKRPVALPGLRWELLIPLTLLFLAVTGDLGSAYDGWLLAGIVNLLILAHATGMMLTGTREGQIAQVVWGSLLLAALVLARYFDLFESFLSRGLAFIVIGGILFAEGILYARNRKATEAAP